MRKFYFTKYISGPLIINFIHRKQFDSNNKIQTCTK